MYDLITIGAATRDVFLVSDKFIALKSRKFGTGAGECVALGSKIEVEELVLTTGGGATNAAATFASLGFRVATICRIGDDSPGKDVIEDLTRSGVSTHLVRRIKGGETAYSTLLTMKDGERTALVHRGTSSAFTPSDIPASIFEATRWIYLTSLGGNLPLVKRILVDAQKAGVKIAWNPGEAELKGGLTSVKQLLPLIAVLIMNMEEAKLLTGKKNPAKIFELLHADGTVRLVTDGTNGSTVYRDGWMAHAGTSGVKGISRTGAGDAFGSGFVAGLMKTEDLKDALRIGTLNAESVIQHFGAKKGILKTWPNALKKQRIKITVL
ncbi:carbohydrate kinase family protein [Candidatus Uhrbacteria bacterium]|nr:carbohydrate kinase family protein [Candidatus Uhrbacteria bacterium]